MLTSIVLAGGLSNTVDQWLAEWVKTKKLGARSINKIMRKFNDKSLARYRMIEAKAKRLGHIENNCMDQDAKSSIIVLVSNLP